MSPEDRALFQELRHGLANLAPLPGMVAHLDTRLNGVDATLRGVQIAVAAKDAEHATKLDQHAGAIKTLGDRVREHVGQHWTWLLATVGLVAAIMAAAKMLSGKP